MTVDFAIILINDSKSNAYGKISQDIFIQSTLFE